MKRTPVDSDLWVPAAPSTWLLNRHLLITGKTLRRDLTPELALLSV